MVEALNTIIDKVKRVGDHWIWVGALNGTDSRARPVMNLNRKTRFVTHVIWYINTGEFPTKQILHKRECNRIRCVKFEHLYEGTHEENMVDREFFRVPVTHCKHGHKLSGRNVYRHLGKRICKICARIRTNVWRKANA